MIKGIALILALTVLGAAFWQHQRYSRVRRERLGDRQPLLYSGAAFHVLTFVKIDSGKSLIDEMRRLRKVIEGQGGGLMVYAGQVGAAAVKSEQISCDWSGLMLVQYPSRKTFDVFRQRVEYRDALARFDDAYSHGVVRPAGLNLVLVQGLGLLRLRDIISRAPSAFPFVPVGDDATPKQQTKMKEMEQLDALRSITEDAVVIFNLIKPGNSEQRRADRGYAIEMMRGMAEGGYGPMHMGKATTIEGDAEFEQFAAVYYPGIDFLQRMIGSQFMSRIGGDKQLGDSLAVVTVPILSRL